MIYKTATLTKTIIQNFLSQSVKQNIKFFSVTAAAATVSNWIIRETININFNNKFN